MKARDEFDVDYFLEDLGEHPPMPPFPHRIVDAGRYDNGAFWAQCACEWADAHPKADGLAYLVDAHMVRNTAGLMHKAVA